MPNGEAVGIEPIRIPGWISAHIIFSSLNNIMQYAWSYQSSNDVQSPTTLNAFCQDLWNLIVVPWKTIHPTTTTLLRVEAESNYPGVPNYVGVYNGPTGTIGNNANPVLPGNVALAVAKLTGVRGRAFNGRTYLANLSESDVTGDTAGSSYLTSAMVFMAQHLNAITRDSIVFAPAVPSRRFVVMTPINALRANAATDSQRRRLTGRGS